MLQRRIPPTRTLLVDPLVPPSVPLPPLTVDAYSRFALGAEQKGPETVSFDFALLGLFGETGTLLSAVKKKQRDEASFAGYESAVVEELGDVLWYLNVVAHRGSLSLTAVAAAHDRDFVSWDQAIDPDLTFSALQPTASGVRTRPSREFERDLLELAGHVGLLMTDHAANRLSENRDSLSGRLIAIFRSLIRAASAAGVTLEEAARSNLDKIFDRWPEDRIFPEFRDTDLPVYERLPRRLVIDVTEETINGKTYVYQRCNDINIGDRLTDNILGLDDYRFHDVFHYAYVAVLGWSPVTRALFRLKRKSQPQIDEAEDGARATLIEEGVTTWIFGQAKNLALFESVARGHLSFDLLKTVRRFVAGYEAERLPLWLWEEAILQGYEAFRFLKKERRGRLTIDMDARTLTVQPLPR